jgi:hypothetical protein
VIVAVPPGNGSKLMPNVEQPMQAADMPEQDGDRTQ